MQPKTEKYILDIESAIAEIENLMILCENQYVKFENNPLAIRSLERLLEIIGEATKKTLDSNTSLVIANSQRIYLFEKSIGSCLRQYSAFYYLVNRIKRCAQA